MNTTDTVPETTDDIQAATLSAIATKLDALQAQLDQVQAHQRQQAELIEELSPILRQVMDVGMVKLQGLEEKGYFAFGKESLGIVDRIITNYSAEDVRLLGENAIAILDTVKKLTQPNVLSVINDATEAFYHPEEVEQVGLYGMYKASKEDDVRKGFGVMLALLRSLGQGTGGIATLREKRRKRRKGSERSKEEKRALVTARLAPKQRDDKALPAHEEPTPSNGGAKAKPTPAPLAPATEAAREGFDAQGYLLDAEAWTPELADDLAASLGIQPLTEAHWQLLRYAREAYQESGKSPNIRQISTDTGVHTREIYALFPKAPGRAIAKIAGIPKPGGCL